MSKFGSLSSFSYQGLPIEYDRATGLVCLTDLWRAQCSPASQRPLAWVRLEATQKLLKQLAKQTSADPLWSEWQHPRQEPKRLIVAIPGILETTKKEGDLRTYATTDLVVVYARYLAQECYVWALANLAEEAASVEEWLAQQSQRDLQKRRKVFTRRAVIAAGWSIPVVSALALNQRAAAQVSAGRGRTTGTTTNPTRTGTTTNPTGTGTTTNPTRTGTTTNPTGTGTTTNPTGTGTTTNPTGTGTITNPSGIGTTTNPSGIGTTTNPSGIGTTTNPSGIGTTTNPSGIGTTTNPSGIGTTTNPSGIGTTTNPSGIGTTTNPSGIGTTTNPSGIGTTTNPSGTGTITNPTGTGTITNPTGTGTITNPTGTTGP